MGVSLGLKLAPVEDKLRHTQQQLSVWEAKGHDTHVPQRLLPPLRGQADALRADQGLCQRTRQQAAQAGHPFTVAHSRAHAKFSAG